MIYLFKKKNLFKIIIIIFISLINYGHVSSKEINQIKILKKINNQIITNYDVEREYNYLLSLNNNLKSLSMKEGLQIAEESLIREIIKLIEIKKLINIENFQDKALTENIIKNIIKNLKFENKQDLEQHLKLYGLSIAEIENKLLIEIYWNQLITSKYKNQIKINKENLIKKINEEKLNKKNITQYELSELLFKVNNNSELESKTNLIFDSIKSVGFKNTAIKFSISDSSKLGGFLGEIKENQLSDDIKKSLSSLKIGEYTKPINIGGNFLILYINNKKIIEEVVDKEMLLKRLIDFETQKQLNNFSQIYFNRIKVNTQIDEF